MYNQADFWGNESILMSSQKQCKAQITVQESLIFPMPMPDRHVHNYQVRCTLGRSVCCTNITKVQSQFGRFKKKKKNIDISCIHGFPPVWLTCNSSYTLFTSFIYIYTWNMFYMHLMSPIVALAHVSPFPTRPHTHSPQVPPYYLAI